MINADMRLYDYFLLGIRDEYGQLSKPDFKGEPAGQVKMAINTTSQSIQDNINYKDSTYMGLTHSIVEDTFVIKYGNEFLKVLYVNPKGRLKQVFLASYET